MNKSYWDYKNIDDFIDSMDFEILVEYNPDEEKNMLRLHDLQGANLGGIEEEWFANFEQVVDRMGVYIDDYFIRPIEEEFDDEIGDWNTFSELYNQLINLPKERKRDWEWTINIIGLIGGEL